jgi:hypothetical protein
MYIYIYICMLSGLTVGDGSEFDSFIVLLKSCHELISVQISDLRSVVCKEACRTVALIARKLGIYIDVFHIVLCKYINRCNNYLWFTFSVWRIVFFDPNCWNPVKVNIIINRFSICCVG